MKRDFQEEREAVDFALLDAYYNDLDVWLEALQALPEAKTMLGHWTCWRCHRVIEHPEMCMSCGDLVCPDDPDYPDFRRPAY
jgi:hypothetical protein